MTTTIASTMTGHLFKVTARDDTTVSLAAQHDGANTFDRDEFLAAVAAELDVIVIPRADLPEVTEGGAYYAISDKGIDIAKPIKKNLTAAQHRRLAAEHLALAEHLTAHPPVSEAEVATLADLLIGADMDGEEGPTPTTVARRLLATGRVYLAKEA